MKLRIVHKAFPALRVSAIGAIFVSAALANVYLFAPLPANGAQTTGLAYDEVTKIMLGSAAPDPGTFSADFDAAVSAQRSTASSGTHHGLFGTIMNAMDVAKNAMNVMRSGTASSKYYLGGWERTDDAGAQTAVIDKPQQHQIIYLNLAKKTYRVVDTNVQMGIRTPPPAPMEQARNAAGPPPQPGSGKLNITVSSTALGPRVIDNIATSGYRLTFDLTESQSTGSCTDGHFQTSMVEYVSRYAQPGIAAAHSAGAHPTIARPELMALKPGCSPTISMHATGGAHAPAGRLAVWMLVTVSAGAPTAQGQMNGGFTTLLERGNVRTLGMADKTLFDIPPGFTKE